MITNKEKFIHKNKEKNFVSAVVYLHNYEIDIITFLDELQNTLSNYFEKYEIICVNDHSTDSSLEKIKDFADNLSGSVISVINMSYYQGLEMSMNAGMDLAIGDFVFEFDTIYIDYEIDNIMEAYWRCLNGNDIVRVTPNGKKRFSSRAFYKMFNSNTNYQYKLDTESFRILSRRAINRVQSMSQSIPYRKAIYANCGLKMDTISYDPISSVNKNITKYQKHGRKDLAFSSLVLFTDSAYKITITMIILMIISIIFTVAYSLIYYFTGNPVEGWTTTILFLSFSFLGVFFIFAIIMKYLLILVDLVFKKQKYTIESIEKISK